MNEEIKVWYKNTYPRDYSAWVAPNVTFSDLFKMLVHKEDVYDHNVNRKPTVLTVG